MQPETELNNSPVGSLTFSMVGIQTSQKHQQRKTENASQITSPTTHRDFSIRKVLLQTLFVFSIINFCNICFCISFLHCENTCKKTILGSDCVLDLHSVDNICQNLKRFFEWSTENCNSGERRIQALEERCRKVIQFRLYAQSHW